MQSSRQQLQAQQPTLLIYKVNLLIELLLQAQQHRAQDAAAEQAQPVTVTERGCQFDIGAPLRMDIRLPCLHTHAFARMLMSCQDGGICTLVIRQRQLRSQQQGVGVVLIEGRQQFDRMHVHCAGASFYRAESAQARDLAVLAAVVYKRQTGHLRVLDIACGCGGRAARYLSQVCTAPLLLMLRLCCSC